MKRAVFAGSFNPFTSGHYDIVSRASKMFDEVVVAVADDSTGRASLLCTRDRIRIAKESVADLNNVKVETFCGMLVSFAKKVGANVLVRGLRSALDFEYEKGLCEVYKRQCVNIECIYLLSNPAYTHISATVVRQLAQFGERLDGYVQPSAVKLIEEKYKTL